MSQTQQINELLDAFGNITRRNILNSLADDSKYILEMSKELNVNRSAITKHLENMEEIGILSSSFEPKDTSQKKFYKIATNRRLEVELTPNYFSIDLTPINLPFEKKYKIKRNFSNLLLYENHLKEIETVNRLTTKLKLLFSFAKDLQDEYSKFDLARNYLKYLITRLKNDVLDAINKTSITEKDKKKLKSRFNSNFTSIKVDEINNTDLDEKLERIKRSLFR